MELNFGQNIKRLRRDRDLTQEALADALGVSAQSVSKWECAYGYPDITQLPAIANFFGVTVDELLSNDKDGREEIMIRFDQLRKEYEEASEEQIAFVREYCRRYPDEPYYTYILCGILSYHIIYVPEHRTQYEHLLRSSAEKLLDNVVYRNMAIGYMVQACREEELDEWLKLAAYNTNHTRRNLALMRFNILKETTKHQLCVSLANLETIANQLDKRYPDAAGPEAKGAYHKAVLNIIASFGTDGQIPDGWLAFTAHKELVYAACLFGMGKHDQGKVEFLAAIEKLRRYHSLTDEYLDTGSPLFGGLHVDKKWLYVMDKSGEKHKLYGTVPLSVFGKADHVLNLLTDPRWAWFNSVRDEDYYKDAVEWLQGLANE